MALEDPPCLGGWPLIKINSLHNNIVIVIYSNSDDIKYKKSLLIGSIMLFASNQYLALKSFKRLDICIKKYCRCSYLISCTQTKKSITQIWVNSKTIVIDLILIIIHSNNFVFINFIFYKEIGRGFKKYGTNDEDKMSKRDLHQDPYKME